MRLANERSADEGLANERLAYAALGANLGDRHSTLMEAIRRLESTDGIGLSRISGVYETAPVGVTDQPSFLNMAVALRTGLEPLELLRRLLGIENELGRVRTVRWGPRLVDLDLLLYEGAELDSEELTLPHPRMHERAFVLVPLQDVWLPESGPFPWKEHVTDAARRKEGIQLWESRESGL
ncbi:2-amino-4-hydroxy-6-hydroxymethyldihydropteridine diphosphokinase [Cohnella fermenti]|uniref:2-amino-4-hydroxy-6-hydroxymethyldihydropteridine diphosphokinase n=1 Tax=Cohnella fermenti TaxID=2565925 RepID=A0A4S4BIU4_9BACL|nr:2-amino-4-hydroxy-6-hydroxymethyldihydropteridine diphosphokinase [Cohnella fermenti]THF74535.1 2-amino-4-hydroxy-6-hydroxymethyldihydropteridine diphosphokinase [Cohnella fermenti]